MFIPAESLESLHYLRRNTKPRLDSLIVIFQGLIVFFPVIIYSAEIIICYGAARVAFYSLLI